MTEPTADVWSRGWPAPAKLNLFLHITGRRVDGYHELQTVFRLLDMADLLDFAVSDDGRIRRAVPLPGIAEQQDLTVRAAQALRDATGTSRGACIRLHKQLPMGGGLGGGSSDAATTLLALNHLWRTGLSLQELAEIGLGLGADVPVFVHGRSSWAEGVGERLQPLDLAPSWYVVLCPECPVSTAEVFADPELTRDSAPIRIPAFLAGGGRNVCEPVVSRKHAEVAQALEWLGGFGSARMSGTGACVFLACVDQEQACSVAESARQAGWPVRVARGRDRSDVHARIDAEAGATAHDVG
ncbi:4-(cytidine 5'-diphospho)-2-C-methyl-D-erythritol kinase [Methylonatrum kenyense]|uniref:4-(cytidine 5'-diphospho)-2-C-methyl-D-erythritol kinase n=1 Tax=Methylonatrum kenyense TaxID=455253 RepID=UPI0020BE5059|nr:4-(cytidine 5'-diphospho)-2-C-methyl-D-erythritol kinase [Methylonatrum kenyense]